MTDDNNQIIKVDGDELLINNNDFDSQSLINSFLADTQNLKSESKKGYRKSLKKYFNWVKQSDIPLQNSTLTEVLMYKKYLEDSLKKDGEKLSDYTIGTYLIAVKLWWAWANAKGIYLINPAKSLKAPKKESRYERKPLDPEQIQQLFDYFKIQSLRDYAIITTLYYCALRTIELVRLDFGDIQMIKNNRVIWVQGKGKTKKDRRVPLFDKAALPITEYLKTRKNLTKDSPIFVSESIMLQGGRLTTGRISHIVKAGLRAIGIDSKEYTAHSIRHSSATNAIRAGASEIQVQKMLRHVDIKTTKIYKRSVEEEDDLNNAAGEFL